MPSSIHADIDRRQLLRIVAGAVVASAGVVIGGEATAAEWVRPARSRPDRLRAGFSSAIGRWQAGDIPHPYPLPDGRTLWLLNDSFLSDEPDGPITERSSFVRNTAFIERAGNLTHIDIGDASFLAGGEQRYDRWWWFHGGAIDGRLLHVVATEMVRIGPYGWAINFDPVSTWITSIEWQTQTIVAHRPAPDPGVDPVYGFSVASDSQWTYLIGNAHIYGRSTTTTRVARVPRGRLLEAPSYWNGNDWVNDRAAAAVVHETGSTDCRLHVSRSGNRWLAVTKLDEFLGTDVVIYDADAPQGPYREILRFRPPTRTGDDRTCTYDAMASPLDDGRVLVWWSNNAFDEALTRRRPDVYRPRFAIVELPSG